MTRCSWLALSRLVPEVASDSRRLLLGLPTLGAVLLAVAPAVVAFGLGWLPPGKPAAGAADRTPEVWALFALLYLVWLFGLMLLLIVVNDRMGRHWRSWDRAPRPQKKRRRRMAAGMKYLEGQQEAQAEAAREAARARRADDQPGADDELRAAAESAGSNGSGDPRRVG